MPAFIMLSSTSTYHRELSAKVFSFSQRVDVRLKLQAFLTLQVAQSDVITGSSIRAPVMAAETW